MDPGSTARLVADLLLAAQTLSGYAPPPQPPDVAFVPQAVLQREACQGPCAIYGWFPPGTTIYLDERLDLAEDMRARGILVHELVHYLQQESRAFAEETPCHAWLAREREAFDIQYRWLVEEGVALAAYYTYSGRPWRIECDEPSEQAES